MFSSGSYLVRSNWCNGPELQARTSGASEAGFTEAGHSDKESSGCPGNSILIVSSLSSGCTSPSASASDDDFEDKDKDKDNKYCREDTRRARRMKKWWPQSWQRLKSLRMLECNCTNHDSHRIDL